MKQRKKSKQWTQHNTDIINIKYQYEHKVLKNNTNTHTQIQILSRAFTKKSFVIQKIPTHI